MDTKKPKILIISDTPTIHTGMGIAHHEISTRLYNLKKYEIASVGWFAHTAERRGLKWEYPWKLFTIPDPNRPYGHPNNWPKDPNWDSCPVVKIVDEFAPRVIICIGDHWMGDFLYDMPNREKFKLIHEFPIDGSPIPSEWITNIKRADIPVVMTRFAYDEIRKKDEHVDVEINPRGLETGVFFKHPQAKEVIRKHFMPDACGRFVVGVFDRFQDRKQIGRALEGFRKFLDKGRHDDCDIYLHMDFKDSASMQQGKTLIGPDGLLKRYNLDGQILYRKDICVERGVGVRDLAGLYSCCDVKLSASQGEGFGLTTVEAMGCGVPCIATNYTSFPEFFGDNERGLLADVKTTITGMYNVERALVDTDHIAELLERLYRSPKLRDEIGNKASRWTKQFDWNSNIVNWVSFIERCLDDSGYEPIGKKREAKEEEVTKAINIQGAVYENTGFSIVTQNLAVALDNNGISTSVEPRVPQNAQFYPVSSQLNKLIQNPKNNVFELINHMGDEQIRRLPESNAKYRIAYFPWEISNIKNEWVDILNREADAVWCNSSFTANIYKNAGVQGDKIAVIPNGVCLPRVAGMEHAGYKFLCVGNLGDVRKNTKTLVYTYLSAFTEDDNVELVLKSQPGHPNSDPTEYVEFLRSGHKNSAKITIIHADYKEQELAQLYADCDCYVTTSHAEGFCQPILEATALGMPVVAPMYGGYLDFASQGMFFGVPVSMVEATTSPVYCQNAKWSNVEFERFSEAMRNVYESNIRPTGDNPIPEYTWDTSAKKVMAEMDNVAKRCSKPKLRVYHQNFCRNLWNDDNRMNFQRYAPSDVKFVEDYKNADFQIVDITRLSDKNNIKCKDYVALFHCKGEWSEESIMDYIDIFENAVLVYSHLDIKAEMVAAGWTEEEFDKRVNFMRGPWGVDEDLFVHLLGSGKRYTMLSTGAIPQTEGIAECVSAVDAVSGQLLHIGPHLGYKNKCYVNTRNLDQKAITMAYNVSHYVNALRRIEGFEKPAIEGALCGARPICFDTPLYRHWYEDVPRYVREGTFEETTKDILDILQGEHKPITDEEKEFIKDRFSWRIVAKNFWERLMKCEEDTNE